MALFKRRRDDAHPEKLAAQDAEATPDAETAPDAVTARDAAALPDAEPAVADAPAVGISVSSYGGFGAAATKPAEPAVEAPAPQRPAVRGPELAPPATETIPGLRDNVLLRDALASLPEKPTNDELAGVARHLLQGHLFLRVKGDARALLSEGKDLPLAIATRGDQQFVLVYSGGSALQAAVAADKDTDTSAMGQPVLTVLRYVLASPYAGIIIDGASGAARAVFPRALLERMLAEAEPELEIKTLLAGDRTDETPVQIATAMTRAKFWLAVNTATEGRYGVAEARSPQGDRLLEVYSHPLEVIAMGRGDRPAPMTPDQLKNALRADEGITGVIVDAAGPWIKLSRDELAPLLAD